jgi:glycosyltransferase involved in cell wall biosynthesis
MEINQSRRKSGLNHRLSPFILKEPHPIEFYVLNLVDNRECESTMPKVLFNCSTNVVGGGVKNAAIFIREVQHFHCIDWVYAVSPQVHALLEEWRILVKDSFVFKISPSRSIKARRELLRLEKDHGVDCVYTMSGPSYVTFSSLHIQGISNPHITHADLKDVGFILSIRKYYTYLVHTAYQRYMSKKADFFVFQTESSRVGFCERTGVKHKNTIVIPNAIDISAFEFGVAERNLNDDGLLKILCPAAPYPHKCLGLIPHYAAALKSMGFERFVFYLTIHKESYLYRKILCDSGALKVQENVESIGAYSYKDVSLVYESSDMVFIPSLVETFSATYLEAFAARRPLLAADRPFAKDICSDAAVYVEPKDPIDVAKKIINLNASLSKQRNLVAAGSQRMLHFDSQSKRVEKLCGTILEIARRVSHV